MIITAQTLYLILGCIIGIGTIFGIVFGISRRITKPQAESARNESLFALQLQTMQADLVNMRDNHIHTLDVKLDQTNVIVTQLSKDIVRLTTVLEERLPRK